MKSVIAVCITLLLIGCRSNQLLQEHAFPRPVDTSDRPVQFQEKRTVTLSGVTASNDFDGARMNGFTQVNDSTYRVSILPENEPINESPHFAFSLVATGKRKIELEIDYGKYKHRYWPKLSRDKQLWVPIDSIAFDTLKSGSLATLAIELDESPLYIAAQELKTSQHTIDWITDLKNSYSHIRTSPIGKSKLDREIHYMDIGEGDDKDKPTILILSRTHPPEISGYLAMEYFVEELLSENTLSEVFRKKYRIMVYPLINPDGVDLGFWRHNAGGIDLNRDWSHFRQPETRAVATHVLSQTKAADNQVVLGIDFHSTQEDVIYTHTRNRISSITPFKDLWIEGLEHHPHNLHPNEEAYDLSSPMTKGWFYMEFGAEALIYEVGDETDRDFVKLKAETAAREMMKLLVLR